MKVALVSPYDLGRFGGVQDQVALIAATLREMGHAAIVVGPGSKAPDGSVLVGGVTQIRANGSRTPISLSPRAAGRAVAAVAEADVVHIHEPLMPMISLTALRKVDQPIVATFHADPPRSVRRAYRIARPVLRRFVRRTQVVTAVSPVAAVPARAFGPVEIVPNAIDTSPVPDVDKNPRRVVFLGRDDPRKGLAVLRSAWPRVRKMLGDAELLVIGCDGDTDPSRGITYVGRVPEDEKRRLLTSAGVFCAPNLGGESFGITVAEAMASGAAIVATGIPAFVHLLAGAGALVPPGNGMTLATELVRVLTDDVARAAMQAAAVRRAQDFDRHRVVERYLELYTQAIEDR